MRLDIYVPVLVAVLFGLTVRPMAGLVPPVAGVRVLVGTGVCCALGWVWSLGLLAWTGLAQLQTVAGIGGWSTAVLRAGDPVPAPVAYACGGLLLAVTAAFSLATTRRVRAVWTTSRLGHRLGQDAAELVVLPDLGVEAFALPALGRRGGRIVVSAGMLRALDVEERRVLFAHERAHLTGAHHWWLLTSQLCAAANPVLARMPAAVEYLLERAADEAAATAVGDRRLAARALARAGLALLHAPGAGVSAGGIALGNATTAVQSRVAALLTPPPPARRWLLAAVLLTVAAAAVAAVDAGRDLEQLFELAIAANRGRQDLLPGSLATVVATLP